MRLSECAIRFLLAAALAGTEIFGGHALFALAMVGVAGSGLEGVATPLGAALGVSFLSGFGPRLEVQILPVGAVHTSFDTEFETAGINQTRHKISLEATASVRIVLPSGARTVSVRASALMAESILIGDVPQSYIQVPEVEDGLNFVA